MGWPRVFILLFFVWTELRDAACQVVTPNTSNGPAAAQVGPNTGSLGGFDPTGFFPGAGGQLYPGPGGATPFANEGSPFFSFPQGNQFVPQTGQSTPQVGQFTPQAGQFTPQVGQAFPQGAQGNPQVGPVNPQGFFFQPRQPLGGGVDSSGVGQVTGQQPAFATNTFPGFQNGFNFGQLTGPVFPSAFGSPGSSNAQVGRSDTIAPRQELPPAIGFFGRPPSFSSFDGVSGFQGGQAGKATPETFIGARSSQPNVIGLRGGVPERLYLNTASGSKLSNSSTVKL